MTAELTIPTNCDNCGACCMGQNLLPLSGNGLDETRLPVVLQESLERIIAGPLRGHDECPCVWLDRASGLCLHYQYRPSVCRDLEVGDEDCMRIRRKAGVA